MKILKLNIPAHKFGRSFREDFPIAAIDGYTVGAYAHLRATNFRIPLRNNVIGKVSLSTDNGEVVHPSLPIMFTPVKGTINKMMSPIDYEMIGNKFTVVVEENTNIAELKGKNVAYELEIILKTVKRADDVKDLNRHRTTKAC